MSINMKRAGKKSRRFTITEAARELKVSRQAIHEAIKRGELEAKWGKIVQVKTTVTEGWQIPARSLNDYEVSLHQQKRGKKT
jgi:biotin operon repressor